MAFLVLLESLSPLERAVFLLREVFDYAYAVIAQIIGRNQAACRQLFSRAKKHIRAHRPRFPASPEVHANMVGSFMEACIAGDMDGLMSLLAEDVTVWSDGGGKSRVSSRWKWRVISSGRYAASPTLTSWRISICHPRQIRSGG